MIRLWKPSDEDALKSLWRDTFGDPDVYINDVIFKYKTSPESVMISEKDGELLSAVHMPETTLSFWGEALKTAYVMGVATAKRHRGHAYMRPLMGAALGEMYGRGTTFCTLIPAEDWLYDYYSGFGFFEAFYLKKSELSIAPASAPSDKVSDCTDDGALYRFYRDYYKDEPFFLNKSRRDFDAVLTDHRLGGGRVLAYKAGGEIEGICFLIDADGCLVKELCANDENVRRALLSAAAGLCGTDRVWLISRPGGSKEGVYRRGMIRAVNALCTLSVYAAAHRDETFAVSLRDGDIPENSGVYEVKDGAARKLSDELDENALSPAEFMRLMLKGETCYMNLMLD
ncbi:MAG: GNAT family N-acetyltransferase [Clostridia bacterium]|nr:GNAT family N-acetyltransferase [Clostridia bacterium]